MELLEGGATLLFFLVLTCLLAWRQKLKRQRVFLPPGPTPLPLVGNVLQLYGKSLIKALLPLSETYGPVYTVYLGTNPVVVLCGADVLKEALIDQGDTFSGRGDLPVVQLIFKGYGIIFSNGERWKQLRRFSLMTLRNFGMGKRSIEERIQEEAQHLVEELRRTKELPFDPTFFFSRAVSNIICSVVFGNRYEYEDKEFLALLGLINENFRLLNSSSGKFVNFFPCLMQWLPGPFHRLSRNITELKNFVLEHVKAHRNSLDPNSPRDFIDCFLIKMDQEATNADSEFGNENMVASTLNLFFAGTETVSTTLRYGFLILSKYPEVEQKVHEEIDRIIGRERSPRIEDRSKMSYTDAVIHEIQRFSDIIPGGVPRCTIKDTKLRGFLIPKGTTVFPLLTTGLKDASSFENPEKFDPKHFLDESGAFKKNESFIPFSAGKRICVGEGLARMELFLFFSTILQNFNVKPLVDPESIDLRPAISGLGNIPPAYQLCLSPRS
ncbi:cytochrome P450 2G1-like [Ambystoma mexicanum]|uniref:cytochrome P450 2G1-like n=1 Tax=Ambystoma mexicanum TaxID=8296 RepID=UPI0037E98CF3